MIYDIQLNESGTRHLNVSDAYLTTIRKYNLFHGLRNSSGYVTEDDLEKLRLNLRALIGAKGTDTNELLDLCIYVIYHDKMKAYGLKNLIALYDSWSASHPETESGEENVAE